MKPISKLEITYPKIENLAPILLIPREINEQIVYFVEKSKDECQWFHTVTKSVDNNNIVYRIDNLFIPKQIVSGAEVESLGNTFEDLLKEIKAKYNNVREQYNPILQSLTCWSHSHVNMGVTPSGTDIDTFKQMIENGTKYNKTQPQVMMILNKKNDVFSQCYDPELNVLFKNLPVYIEEPYEVDYSYVEEAVKEKLIPKVLKPIVQTAGRPIYDQKQNPWELYERTTEINTFERHKGDTNFTSFLSLHNLTFSPFEKDTMEHIFEKVGQAYEFAGTVKALTASFTLKEFQKFIEFIELKLSFEQNYYLFLLLKNITYTPQELTNLVLKTYKEEDPKWYRKYENIHINYSVDIFQKIFTDGIKCSTLQFILDLLICVSRIETATKKAAVVEGDIFAAINNVKQKSTYIAYKNFVLTQTSNAS